MEFLANGIQAISLCLFNDKIQFVKKLRKEIVLPAPFTLIFPLHLPHGGAKNCSKQYSQYKSPFSSTNPISASSRLQLPLTQTK